MRKLWSHKQTGKNCKIDKKKGLSKISFLEIIFFLKSKWLQGVCELKILYTMPGTRKRKEKKISRLIRRATC